MNKNNINIKKIETNYFKDFRGELSVYDFKDFPFKVVRVFTVKANANEIRGNHAHKKCLQLMFCLSGKIKICIDNGYKKITKTLSKPNLGILVPNGFWASQTYLENNSIMIVFCDRIYEKDDYIHDYKKFQSWKNKF